MKAFARLFEELDSTNKTNAKVAAMGRYFSTAPAADCAWAAFFLCGGKLRAPVSMRAFRKWAVEVAGLSDWLFDECYAAVGDVAETVALLFPNPGATINDEEPLEVWVENRLAQLRPLPEDEQKAMVLDSWNRLNFQQRVVWNKLITGAFRVGVSKLLVIRAISLASGVTAEVIAHRMMGEWAPSAAGWSDLLATDKADTTISRPYPFCLAYPLQAPPATLGPVAGWVAEWKWDGIRAQVIRRQGRTFIWSRGNELITDRFPEVEALGASLPDGTAIDGELVAWQDNGVLPFAHLQTRIGRTKLSKAILAKVPVTLLTFDILEWNGEDVRGLTLRERRGILESLDLRLSPVVAANSWDQLAQIREKARDLGAEGLMLKGSESPYSVGREKGIWWKWKVDPYTVDAILIYAQKGSGKRAGLFTDYTFGVWSGKELVPFAKAYSGLTDAEIQEVDRFIRRNTLAKFGPVSTVKPELVFEIAFEGIQSSSRHKSGVAVRFPRMARWRTDKRPEDADTIEAVKALVS